jgi:methylmalonyl-CoA mutase C-terminal domain/subunit
MGKIRVIIGMVGMDQHEVGAIAVSRILMEAGMEVIYLGRFQSPDSIVKAGIDEAADVIGISCHSWEYLYFLPDILSMLKARHVNIPVIIGGSIITDGDKNKSLEMGVAAVFEAGSGKDEIIEKIKELAAEGTA